MNRGTVEAEKCYVYAVAGGETLTIIDHVKKMAEEAEHELSAYVAQFGIKWERGTQGRIDSYQLIDPVLGNQILPAGWEVYKNRQGQEALRPSMADMQGLKIGSEINRLKERMNEQVIFDRLCHSLGPSVGGPYKYLFEQVGSEVIIHCPKAPFQREGQETLIPPGSTPITFLDYIRKKEQVNPSKLPKVKAFEKPFTP